MGKHGKRFCYRAALVLSSVPVAFVFGTSGIAGAATPAPIGVISSGWDSAGYVVGRSAGAFEACDVAGAYERVGMAGYQAGQRMIVGRDGSFASTGHASSKVAEEQNTVTAARFGKHGSALGTTHHDVTAESADSYRVSYSPASGYRHEIASDRYAETNGATLHAAQFGKHAKGFVATTHRGVAERSMANSTTVTPDGTVRSASTASGVVAGKSGQAGALQLGPVALAGAAKQQTVAGYQAASKATAAPDGSGRFTGTIARHAKTEHSAEGSLGVGKLVNVSAEAHAKSVSKHRAAVAASRDAAGNTAVKHVAKGKHAATGGAELEVEVAGKEILELELGDD